MSALAKTVLSFNDATLHFEGNVWVPERQWEKFVELARREVSAEKRAAPPHAGHHDPRSCGCDVCIAIRGAA